MTQERFPRYCDITKQGMWAGWCINDGDKYVKHEFDAVIEAMKAGYASLQDAYNDDYMYYSEWTDAPAEDWHEQPNL
jgi:hypothetical protein